MDETVYQCPECNFNTDNIANLDAHIFDMHENDNDDFNNSLNSPLPLQQQQKQQQQQQQHQQNDDIDDDNYINRNIDDYNDDLLNGDDYDEDDYDDRQNINYINTLDLTLTNKSSNNKSTNNKQPQQPQQQQQQSTPLKSTGQIPNTDNHYERQYSCKFCSYFTNNPRAILYHRKNFHMEKIPIYECTYCQYASQYSGKVERHTLLRHKIDIANTSTTTTSSQQQQQQQAISNDDNDEYDNNSAINNNNNNQTTNDGSTTTSASAPAIAFQCDKCPCKYKRSNDLYKHLRLKHSNNQQNNENADDSNSTLNDTNFGNTNGNGSSSSNNNELKYECPYCTYTTIISNDYLQHIKDHLGGKTFRCILCNAIYKYRGDCVVHLKRKHQKADLIAQNYVQRINIDEINLSELYSLLKPKMYDDIDNDDKLFGCYYCDYKANYKGDVYKHQTRRHPGTPKNVKILNPASIDYYSANQPLMKQQQLDNGGGSNNNGNNQSLDYSEQQQNQHQDSEFYDEYDEDDDEVDGGGGSGGDESMRNQSNIYGDEYDDLDNEMNYNSDSGDSLNNEENYQQMNSGQSTSSTITPPPQQQANGDYLYECKLCPYKAKNSAKLQFHMSTHDNLKPYMCPICKKRSNFKWDIQKHLRKVHMNEHDEVICLSPNEAKETIDQYIEYYGNGANSNVKKFNNQLHSPGSSSPVHQNDDFMDSPQQQQRKILPSQQQQHNLPSFLNPNIFLSKHSARERKYKCSLCNRTSKWQWDIRKHLRTVHKEQSGDVVVLNDKDLIKKLTENPSYSRTLALMNQNSPNSDQFAVNDHQTAQTPPPQPQQIVSQPINIHANYVSIGSDSTGNKKFKCTICPYRSNWKADLFRHIRKRHSINQPSIDDVIILTPEEAASSISDYEQTHGIYIRKRSRIDLDQSTQAASAVATTASSTTSTLSTNGSENCAIETVMSDNENIKRPRILLPSNENQQQIDDRMDSSEYNVDVDDDLDKNDSNSQMNDDSSTSAIMIKTFQCTKCSYKTIRKSDLLRHLKVRHGIYTNLNRFFKTITTTNHTLQQTVAPVAISNGNDFNPEMSHTLSSQVKKIIFHKNYYKCTYCLFKHLNKAMVKKHLLTHQLKTNGFKCNICSYKSEWRYSVKKHIISTHWLIPNAAVVKCTLKPNNQQQQLNDDNKINNENQNNEQMNGNIKSESIDIDDANGNENIINENDNKNSSSSNNLTIKREKHDNNNEEEQQHQQQQQLTAAHLKPSSFESSKLVTPNGKSYTSAFVTVSSNGTVVDEATAATLTNCTKKKMYFCESCPYKTNNYCNLKQHLLQHRPEAGHAKCRYCPYYVSMSRLLKQHEVLHPEYIPRERDLNNLSLNTSQTSQQQTESPSTITSSTTNLKKVQNTSTQGDSVSTESNKKTTNVVESNNINANNLSVNEDIENENKKIEEITDTEKSNKQETSNSKKSAPRIVSNVPTKIEQTTEQEKRTSQLPQQPQQQPQQTPCKKYRCKFCPFTNTDINEAKTHGLTHILEQQKAAAAVAFASMYTTELKNKISPSSASSSSSTSPSPSPLSLATHTNNLAAQNPNNLITSRLQQQLQSQQFRNSQLTFEQQQQAALNSLLACPFCEHVSKNTYLANQHLLYHLNTKNNLPKNFLFENQLRQILSIQANNPLNYSLPQTLLPPTLAIPATATFPSQLIVPPIIPAAPQQQQQQSSSTTNNNNKSSNKSQSKLLSNNFNNNRTNSEPEYIDISEYEKFFAVLQEAADQQ